MQRVVRLIGYVDATVADWLRAPHISRTQLRDLLVANLQATVQSAALIDPGITLSSRAINALLESPSLATTKTVQSP